ncbi:hypothetical protein I9Y31_000054 [Clostridium perfringens]|nr:hypothetical protein [Clostridium perfringens]
MDNLMIFENKELGIAVRTIKNDDGSISIDAEDSAIGFGWYQIKNNKKYPKWERMNGFISEFENSPLVGKGDYIPESLFYLLAMKANNEVARKFQTWLAVEVIPAIRKSGQYQLEKKPTSAIDLFEAQVKALREVEVKVEKVDQKVDKKFDELPLFTSDAKALKKLVNRIVVPLLGGKKSNAYKPLSKKVFSDLYGQVHREFGVDCCDEIKRKDLEFAREFISDYRLPTALKNEIDILNNQSKLDI